MVRTGAAALGVLVLAGCMSNPSAAEPPGMLNVEALPAGFVVGTAKDPLNLHLREDGTQFRATADTADVTIRAEASESPGMTMLHLSSTADATLKIDLYISPDGRRFMYTSTCPLMPAISASEMWPHPIHSYAFGNARRVAEGDMVCR